MFVLRRIIKPLVYIFPFLFICLSTIAVAQQGHDLNKLAQDISHVSDQYYEEAARELKGTFYIKNDLKSLEKIARKLIKGEEHALANAVILANYSLISRNIDHRTMPFFLGQLLEHNVWRSAQKLANQALAEGSIATKSEVHFQLGKFYFNHDALDKAIKHLTSIKTSQPLTKDERDYATLIFGIALQKQKKHREAIKIYQRIKAGSPYFQHSRLNLAVAHIRQDWWTDAQIAVDEALEHPNKKGNKEVTDRILLALGYSQLKNEFYRNARNTFRKITLGGAYTNRALHGIGLCAVSQKDYIGALNAFNRLKLSGDDDLVTLESHLMVPYTQDRMGETDQAALGYSEAIDYFEAKIREFEASILVLQNQQETVFDDVQLKTLPFYIRKNYLMLHELNERQASPKIQTNIRRLKAELRDVITTLLANTTSEKITDTKSYLSQSQYGLAKLYDTQ